MAFPRHSGFGADTARSRLVSAGLSLALIALFALVLLRMGVINVAEMGAGSRLVAVQFSGEHAAQQHTRAQPHPQQQTRPHTTTTQQTPPRPVPTPVPIQTAPAFIHLSHDDMAAADIGKMSRSPAESGASQPDGGKVYGPGQGPSGRHLYAAEWVREPTDAEMVTYLPRDRPPGSWALIACKTIEGNHVENCQELDESPPGSGIARGLRQAAWQFLIRPPRVNGTPQVGTWVRIRFDFVRGVH